MQRRKLTKKLNKENIQDIKNHLENYNERRLQKYSEFKIYSTATDVRIDATLNKEIWHNGGFIREKEILTYYPHEDIFILYDEDFNIYRISELLEDYYQEDIMKEV